MHRDDPRASGSPPPLSAAFTLKVAHKQTWASERRRGAPNPSSRPTRTSRVSRSSLRVVEPVRGDQALDVAPARSPASTRSSAPDADVDDSETVSPRETRWRKSFRSSARRRVRSFGRLDRHRRADDGHGRVFSPRPPHRSGGDVLALSTRRATPCASVSTDETTRHSFRRAHR